MLSSVFNCPLWHSCLIGLERPFSAGRCRSAQVSVVVKSSGTQLTQPQYLSQTRYFELNPPLSCSLDNIAVFSDLN